MKIKEAYTLIDEMVDVFNGMDVTAHRAIQREFRKRADDLKVKLNVENITPIITFAFKTNDIEFIKLWALRRFIFGSPMHVIKQVARAYIKGLK